MAFPLAHPAAVLPLRRYCPRYLSFSALVVGSLVPDTAYLLDDLGKFSSVLVFLLSRTGQSVDPVMLGADWDDLSHAMVGSFFYCLPMGLCLLALLFWLRPNLVATLPNPHRDALWPFCQGPAPGFIVQAASLIIGSLLHIAWDQFTNGDRWLASRWDFLHWPVARLGSRSIEVSQLFWLLSTLGGILALAIAYAHFLGRQVKATSSAPQSETRRKLFWVASLLLPVFVALPLTIQLQTREGAGGGFSAYAHRFAGLYVAALCGCLFLLALGKKMFGPGLESEP